MMFGDERDDMRPIPSTAVAANVCARSFVGETIVEYVHPLMTKLTTIGAQKPSTLGGWSLIRA